MGNNDPRLSRIVTLWSVVRQAHDGPQSEVHAAQQQLIDQYGGAVHRYLLGALRDQDAADEVFQEFALRFVRGDFRKADPQRGKFRSFVKSSVYHLIIDHQRRSKKKRQQQEIPFDVADPQQVATEPIDPADGAFEASWRSELLASTWTALEQREASTGKPYYTVLRFRADHGQMRSPQIAKELSQQLGRPINAGNARVLVHRAREVFADLLLDAVEASLANPTVDELESELIELDLLAYCRPALDKRRSN